MRSLSLGRAFGIPLFIHWSFLFLPLWVVYASRDKGPVGVAFALVVLLSMFGCVLLHELGHALMARSFRIRTRDITLYPIGGVARLESTGHSPFEEVCIALAGPAVNVALVFLLAPLVLGGLLLGGPPGSLDGGWAELQAWSLVLGYLTVLCLGNGFLLLFNLIPAFPMDGGRVLRALLTIPLGLLPATRVASTVGLVLAVGMAIVGMASREMPMLVVVSVFVIFAGQAEVIALRRREAAWRQKQEWQRQRDLTPVEPLVRLGNPLDPTVPMRPVGVAVPVAEPGPFTGFLWDPEGKVWVRWVDGQRVDVF